MKKLSTLVCLVLITASCSETSKTAAPTTTAVPTTTAASPRQIHLLCNQPKNALKPKSKLTRYHDPNPTDILQGDRHSGAPGTAGPEERQSGAQAGQDRGDQPRRIHPVRTENCNGRCG